MPRINIDDDVETRPEFWRLLPLCDNNRDIALGQLVRIFRLCQRAFVAGTTVSKRELVESGLEAMIKAGWVIKEEAGGGYMLIEADHQFSWLIANRENGRRGGRPRHEKPTGNPSVTAGYPMGYPEKPSSSFSSSSSSSFSKPKTKLISHLDPDTGSLVVAIDPSQPAATS